MKIELGNTYKDKITGFTGVCTGTVQYLTGCNQALLNPKCGENGEMRRSEWFDEQRLEHVIGEAKVVLENGDTPGFDREAPRG